MSKFEFFCIYLYRSSDKHIEIEQKSLQWKIKVIFTQILVDEN